MGNFNCCGRPSRQPDHWANRPGEQPAAFTEPAPRPQRFVENWVEQSQRDLALTAEERRRHLGTNRPSTPMPPLGTRWAGFGNIDLQTLTFD
jgi:hypothetical protein